MSDSTTIARPYAKAIFEYALAAHQLKEWSEILHALAFVMLNEKAVEFITNPAVTPKQQVGFLLAPFEKSTTAEAGLENLVMLLVQNKRFMLLPDIHTLFEALRAEQEKKLIVDVFSFAELSTAQEQQLTHSLSQRLQRQVTLKVSLDKSLLGGALIQAGDLVIDGSVRGRLNKLRANIAA